MKKKNDVVIYVRNSLLTPSSYYRIIQYTKELDAKFKIRNIAPTKMYKKSISTDKKKLSYKIQSIVMYLVILFRATYFLICDNLTRNDTIIISKHVIPKYMPIFIGFLLSNLVSKNRFYWDFDDYIFKQDGTLTKQEKILGTYSNKIIVTSKFLKKQLPNEWQSKVVLLPTTDGDLQGFNTEELIRARLKSFETEINMVWVGTKSTINYLEHKINILDKTAKIISDKFSKTLVLKVVCNERINLQTTYLTIENIQWTRERAKIEIYKSHIGIMPLDYSKVALGKGGFKLVQYMSTGLPVVASDIGFNKNVVKNKSGFLIDDMESDEEWCESIVSIIQDKKQWEQYSHNALLQWDKNFSYEYNLNFWNKLISIQGY